MSMVQELLSSNRYIVIFLLVLLSSSSVLSQSVLLPADIVIVTVNSSEDSFDFIPLVNLKPGTSIWFSNGTWDSQSFSIIGDEIEVKIIQSIDAGTNVHVNEREDSRVQITGKLSFTGNGDRLIAYQKDEGITRVLFGIGWGNNDIWNEESAIGSKIPESISKDNNSLLQLGLHQNYQYYLRNGASGTPSMLSKFVADASKWRGQDDKEFPFFGTAFRILKPPVILFDESISTIQEGEPILLNAAIYEHDGSRLTVDVAFNTQNSIADTSDMQGFTKYTFNFTGLIGDAIYAIEIPTENNENYEGTENAFFELQNLSKGSLGDFVTHVAFIQDNDLPAMAISEINYTGNSDTDYIDIQNNESVNVDLSGWQLISRNLVHEFDYGTRIQAFQTLRITHPKFRSNQIDGEKPWLTRNSGTLELKNPKGVLVSNLKYRIQEENRDIISRNEIRTTDIGNSSIAASKISSNRTLELSESQIQEMTDKNGWYVVHKDLYSQDVIEMKSYVWNEEENTFEIYDEFNDVHLNNKPRVSYLTKEQLSDDLLSKDTTSTIIEFIEEEFNFHISATDIDGNGVINGSEGFNFLNNYTNNSILVKDLHSIIAREVGLGKIYPYVYLWKNDGQGWMSASILKENDLIPANSSFWIKADSVFSPVDISLYVAPNYNHELVEEEQKLAESSLALSVETEKLRRDLNIELFDEENDIPRDLITPELENELKVMGDEFLFFGAKNGFNWNSRISLERIENQKTVLPLNFESSETGTLTFEVSEWRNIPSDWSIILEDLELDKNYELNQNWTFEIDYLSKEYEKENSNMEERSLVRESDEEELHRFNLVFIPPGVEENETLIPEEISLGQNYPNPFNPTTTIAFYLPEAVPVKLSVFNVVGQPVAVLTEGTLSQGDHEFEWDASGLPSGMYIYQLEVGNKILTQKMTLVK